MHGCTYVHRSMTEKNMGRSGRVEVRRIENKIRRQVTFSKRRNGLLKKAFELSVLCDVELALIIFSASGKLFHFSSSSNMLKIIERYRRCSSSAAESGGLPLSNDTQTNSTFLEYLKLKTQGDYLHQSYRNLLGEDLEDLNMNELDHLENQIETSLSHIRLKKSQILGEQLIDLKCKEQMLQESNRALTRELRGGVSAEKLLPVSWQRSSGSSSNGDELFQRLEYHPSLQVRSFNPSNDDFSGRGMF